LRELLHAAYAFEHLLDMRNRRRRQKAVSKIEDHPAATEVDRLFACERLKQPAFFRISRYPGG
jgi:hypothetical protein